MTAAAARAIERPEVAVLRPAAVPETRTRVLVVNPPERELISLFGILCRTKTRISWRTNCEDGVAALREDAVSIVICERDLPDGDWRDVLAAAQSAAQPPLFIVTSRLADDSLWAEVLNLGGYDVLAKPFDAKELSRVVEMACRNNIKNPGQQKTRNECTVPGFGVRAGAPRGSARPRTSARRD